MGFSRGTTWTPEMVEELKKLRAEGLFYKDIAARMGMSQTKVEKAAGRFGLRLGKKSTTPIPENPVTQPSSSAGLVSIDKIMERFDTRARILQTIDTLPAGKVYEQSDLSRLVCGSDHARFKRCADLHADEFSKLRIRIRTDQSSDGKWHWGRPADIAKLREVLERYQ